MFYHFNTNSSITNLLYLTLPLLVIAISWGTTGLIRHYALARNLMDIPNDRSSHTMPIPRGGGFSIVFTFLSGLTYLNYNLDLDDKIYIAIFGGGAIVAIVGFIDDHVHVAPMSRLLVHFVASLWVLYWVNGLPPLVLLGISFDLGWFGYLLSALGLVWFLNLYNFMDGIDGFASMEAIFSSFIAGLLFLLVYKDPDMVMINLLLMTSVIGFFIWNFPPAKIFMGDVGSGFLGLILGAFAIYSAHIASEMLWIWFILLGVFFVDATYTLIRRLLRGDSVFRAHRSHAYQFASRKHGNHMTITLSVMLINLFWLAPWAAAVAFNIIDGVIAMLFSYTPLVWLAWYYHAGEVEKNIEMEQ